MSRRQVLEPDLVAVCGQIMDLVAVRAIIRAPGVGAHVAEAVKMRALFHGEGRGADVPDEHARGPKLHPPGRPDPSSPTHAYRFAAAAAEPPTGG